MPGSKGSPPVVDVSSVPQDRSVRHDGLEQVQAHHVLLPIEHLPDGDRVRSSAASTRNSPSEAVRDAWISNPPSD